MTRHLHVADAELTDDPLDPTTILAGDPRTSVAPLPGGVPGSRGVWQITPGVVTDVEADEMFVVLSGRATIDIEGEPSIEVGPGDVVVLDPGARTTWHVHETLRKVFHMHEG